MKRAVFFGAVLICLAISASAAPLTLTQYVALGPSYLDSPSYGSYSSSTGWTYNAIQYMIDGTPSTSILTSAAGFTPIVGSSVAGSPLQQSDFIVTGDAANSPAPGFQSWRGSAPGAFAGEYGTMLYFPFSVTAATGSQVKLSDLTVTYSGSSAELICSAITGCTYDSGTGIATVTYGAGDTYNNDDRIGFVGGVRVANGTSGDTPVDSIYDARLAIFWMWNGVGGTTPPEILSSILRDPQLATPLSACASVNLGNSSSGNCFSAAAVPEPGTYALLGTGLLALLAWKRRRQ